MKVGGLQTFISGGFKLSYSKRVKLACFQAMWAAFMSPIPRMAMAGLGGGVDVDFRSPAGTAPDSQTGVGERRDGDAPGGRSRVMCHGQQLPMDVPSRPALRDHCGRRCDVRHM